MLLTGMRPEDPGRAPKVRFPVASTALLVRPGRRVLCRSRRAF